MTSFSYLFEFNPFKHLFNDLWNGHEPAKINNKNTRRSQSTSLVPYVTDIEKEKNKRIKRYQDLPYHNEEIQSSLYYFNQRNLLNIKYFQDELVFLSHMLNRYPILKNLSEHMNKAQLLSKQISFLIIQKNRINIDLMDYHLQLKEALLNMHQEKYHELKQEGARIDYEISNFFKSFCYTKKLVYKMLKSFHLHNKQDRINHVPVN